MCEKCGYSGCRHDWLKWDEESYRRGARIYSQGDKPAKEDEDNPGFCAGYFDAKYKDDVANAKRPSN